MQRKTTKTKPTTKKSATKKPAAKKVATTKRARTKQVAATVPAPRERKKDIVLGLLQREQGATLAELMSVTGWQAHSVRGFISGTLRKKLSLTVELIKDANEPTYRITTA